MFNVVTWGTPNYNPLLHLRQGQVSLHLRQKLSETLPKGSQSRYVPQNFHQTSRGVL